MKNFTKLVALAITLLLAVSVTGAADTQSDNGNMDNAGADRDAKASLYLGSIRSAVRDIRIANKEGIILEGKKAHQVSSSDFILRGWATLEGEITMHEENTIKQHAFAKTVNDQIDSNKSTCSGTVDQGTYDWCLGERARLISLHDQVNSWNKEVNTNKARLEKNIGMLKQVTEQFNRDGNEINRRGEAYLEKYNMLVQRVNDFKVRLAVLQDKFDECKSALEDGTVRNDKMHEICGRMFDGNIIQTAETPDPPTFMFPNVTKRCTPLKTFCMYSNT